MGLFDSLFTINEPFDYNKVTPYKPYKTGKTIEKLNVRCGPSTDFKIKRELNKDTEVKIYGVYKNRFNVDWYYLDNNDYINADYVIIENKKSVKSFENNEEFPYILTKTVFTDKEAIFYHNLIPITAKLGLTIFSKMRIADIVYVPKSHPEYMKWFNYIKAKHIDFVLCNKELKPVLLIEIDDNTHDRETRKSRDEFVCKIFNQLNMPLLQIRRWQIEELEKQIVDALNLKEVVTQ